MLLSFSGCGGIRAFIGTQKMKYFVSHSLYSSTSFSSLFPLLSSYHPLVTPTAKLEKNTKSQTVPFPSFGKKINRIPKRERSAESSFRNSPIWCGSTRRKQCRRRRARPSGSCPTPSSRPRPHSPTSRAWEPLWHQVSSTASPLSISLRLNFHFRSLLLLFSACMEACKLFTPVFSFRIDPIM